VVKLSLLHRKAGHTEQINANYVMVAKGYGSPPGCRVPSLLPRTGAGGGEGPAGSSWDVGGGREVRGSESSEGEEVIGRITAV